MARTFSNASLGRIVTSVGAFTTFPFGTVAAIVRRGTTVGSFNCIGNIAGPLLDTYINTSTNKLGMLWNGGVSDIPAPTITVTSAEGFVFVAVSKATGTVAPRYHKYVYGTDTWTHESSGSTAANNVTAVSAINIGAVSASTDNFNGDIAAYAAFASVVLTDSQLESMAFALSAWTALKPTGMWVLDQADTAQKVLDWTGGGANESSSTGTTVATTSVPILGYGHPVIQATRFTTPANPYFRPGTGASAIGTAGTCTLTIPTGVRTDDVMVISAVFKVGTGTDTIQTPAGWTQLVAPTNGTGASFQTAVFSLTATSGSAGSTVTIAGGIPSAQQINAVFAAYAGADPAPRSSALADNGASASASVAAASASTSANDLVLYAGGVRSSLSGPSGQPTFTGPGNLRAQSTAASSSQNVATFLGDDGGTSGARTITASQSSWSIAGQIILKAATVGTATTLTVQPAGTAPSGGPDTFTGATVLTVQPAGTVPAGSPDDLRAGTVSTVQPAGTAPAGGQCTFTAALGLVVTPAGTSPSGTSDTFTGGTVLTAQPGGTVPAGSAATLAAATSTAVAAAHTLPATVGSTFTAGFTLTAQPAGTLPAGAGDTLNAATALTTRPAGTIPAGAGSGITLGFTTTATPAGTLPAGSPAQAVTATVAAATPAGTLPAGTGVTVTVSSATATTTQPAGTMPAGAGVQTSTGTTTATQPAGTSPAGGTSTVTLGVPGATTLTVTAATTQPAGTAIQQVTATTVTTRPAGTVPAGARTDLSTTISLAAAAAATQPAGSPAASVLATALTALPAATLPAGGRVVYAAATILAPVPAITLPAPGRATLTAQEALNALPAGTIPAGSPAAVTGAATTLQHPGVLTAGAARTVLAAGTTDSQLTAGTRRGPTYTP